MDGQEIVLQWQARYGRLSDGHLEQFLARSEIGELVALPDDAVQHGLDESPRLTQIVMAALHHAAKRQKTVDRQPLVSNRYRRTDVESCYPKLPQRTVAKHGVQRANPEPSSASVALPAARASQPLPSKRITKRRYACSGCNRQFVSAYTDNEPVTCRTCGHGQAVSQVCRGCNEPGLALRGDRCGRCNEARQAAFEAAGRGATGPEGVTARAPGRRKRAWTG